MAKNDFTGTSTANVDQRMDSLKDSVRDFVQTGQDKANDLKDKAMQLKDEALDKGVEVLGRSREIIKLHPIASVAVAFGVGYIVMRIARFL